MTATQPEPTTNGWNDCDAHRRYLDKDGREHVLRCDQERHSSPDDTEAEHHDPDFGAWWYYDDDLVFEE